MSKPLAKSLHTVSVLVNVASHFRTIAKCDAETALHLALEALELLGKADPYGLGAAALKQLKARKA